MRQEEYLNRFTQLQQFKIALTTKKNQDYAGAENAFKNFELIEVITGGRISAAAGILVRMTDKLARIANLMAQPPAVVEESINDSCHDLAVYSDILFLHNTKHHDTLPLPGFAPPPPPEPAVPYIDEVDPEGQKNFDALAEKVLKGEPVTHSEGMFVRMMAKMKLAALQGGVQE